MSLNPISSQSLTVLFIYLFSLTRLSATEETLGRGTRRAATSTDYGGPVARRRRADDGEAEQTRRARRSRGPVPCGIDLIPCSSAQEEGDSGPTDVCVSERARVGVRAISKDGEAGRSHTAGVEGRLWSEVAVASLKHRWDNKMRLPHTRRERGKGQAGDI